MPITQADVDVVHRFYTAGAARGTPTMQSCFTEDAVWHLTGRSPVAGAHWGWVGHLPCQARSGERGTFRADLLVVGVGQEFGRHRVQLIRIRDGGIAEVRGHYSDQYALDAFWQEADRGREARIPATNQRTERTAASGSKGDLQTLRT